MTLLLASRWKAVCRVNWLDDEAMPESDRMQKRTRRDPVEAEKYYHGRLPRQDMGTLLRRNGDFVVRTSEVQKEQRYVISVLWGGRLRHIVVKQKGTKFFLEEPSGRSFSSVKELIEHHLKTRAPLLSKDFVLLLNPIPKQSWELDHSEIVLGKKIGEGTVVQNERFFLERCS